MRFDKNLHAIKFAAARKAAHMGQILQPTGSKTS